MTSEIRLAFESPDARAEATSGTDPWDRISVRDYICDVEIGAFQAERGVRQRIRFNVVLEVSHSAAAQSDDVDKVLSYDTITEAIELQLSTERINLLETLAERVAERVLEDRRALRVFVRIEKLDRIPGALGVEIARSQKPQLDALHPVVPSQMSEDATPHPLVVFLPNKILNSIQLPDWLDSVAAQALPAIICLEKSEVAAPVADHPAAQRRIGLLSIEQNAWVLAGKDRRCVVVDSRTELDWAMKHGQLSVWAPSKIVLDAVNSPSATAQDALGLARWFAAEFSADHISVLGSYPGAENSDRLKVVENPEDL